jgi:tRNA dimethylallyltransferase
MVPEELSAVPGGPLPIIVGPTASGKTALALALAERIPVEVVSCDSVQVYRGFDIGSSKATQEERSRVPHHLLDLVDANEAFNAGMWARAADGAIGAIRAAGRIPLVVGGSGLYLRALLHGLAEAPDVPVEVRDALELRWGKEGGAALHAELLEVDPALGSRLPPGDRQRIVRALAVFHATGKRLSALQEEHRFQEERYVPVTLGVTHAREVLNTRINGRVLAMLDQGLVQEVESLLAAGASPDSRPMQATGYRQIVEMLTRGGSADDVIEGIQQSHRRYAKRQMTWFRSLEVAWMDSGDVAGVAARVEAVLGAD